MSPLRERAAPGALAAVWTGWAATSLPFYPAGLGAARSPPPPVRSALAAPRAGARSRARGDLLPAREHLARAGAPLRGARRRLDRPHLERPARRTCCSSPARCSRRSAASRCCRSSPSSRAGRCAAPSQAAQPCCSRRSSPGCEHQRLPFDGARRRSGSGSPAAAGRAPSPYALWRPLAAHPALIARGVRPRGRGARSCRAVAGPGPLVAASTRRACSRAGSPLCSRPAAAARTAVVASPAVDHRVDPRSTSGGRPDEEMLAVAQVRHACRPSRRAGCRSRSARRRSA